MTWHATMVIIITLIIMVKNVMFVLLPVMVALTMADMNNTACHDN